MQCGVCVHGGVTLTLIVRVFAVRCKTQNKQAGASGQNVDSIVMR